MVDSWSVPLGMGRVGFGWYIVPFGALRFREMYVPWSSPPVAVLSFLSTRVRNAICSVVSDFWPAVRVCALEVRFVWVGTAGAFRGCRC